MKVTFYLALFAALLEVPVALAQKPATNNPPSSSASPAPTPESGHADAYYYFTIGHLDEQQYELTNGADLATQAVDAYKKALDFEPGSVVIMDRLAEVYAKSQRIREAVAEAEEVLKVDPNDVSAHRLLAQIYVRTLGDVDAGQVQQQNLEKAIAEFQAILKIRPEDTYSALWLARLYRFENRHDDAEKVLRGILQQESDNGPALEQLSQILVDEGRSKDAIELLTRAATDSSSPDIYDLLGDAYSQLKDYGNAESAYRKAVEEDPDDPGHRHGLADTLKAQDKFAEALDQFTKLAELEPGTAENFLQIAELDRRLGKYDQAEASLARAKQLSPGSPQVPYNQALLYEDEGRYDDAVKLLTDTVAKIKRQQNSPAALAVFYEQLGHVYRQQQKFTEAIQTYDEMGKLGPDTQKRAQMLEIETYRESHDIERAIAEAKKALADSPQDSNLTISLAMLYGEKTDTAEGTKLLEGLLQGNEGDEEIYIDIAQVQEHGRQFSEAEQSVQKAEQMAHEPADKEAAWFMLGALYERQKKFDQAEQQFRKILDENPNSASTLNYYGYMLADRGIRLDEATTMIERAVQQEPNNGAYLDSLGWAYYKQNKLAEAQEYLEKATGRDSHDPTILSHLGNVYIKLGRNERAAEVLEQSLAEWQKASPADYEQDKVSEIDSQLKSLKRRLAQKSTPGTAKPQ